MFAIGLRQLQYTELLLHVRSKLQKKKCFINIKTAGLGIMHSRITEMGAEVKVNQKVG